MAGRKREQSASVAEPAAEVPEPEFAHVVIEAELVWRGRLIAISYEPDWLDSEARGLSYAHAHLDIRVAAPEGAPIPITETGYRSHFTQPGIVEEHGGPAAFVEAMLNAAATTLAWRRTEARWRQLDLFE